MSLPEEIEESLAPYFTTARVIILPLSSLSALFLVYGIYIMVFGSAIHILLRNQSTAPSKLYIWCTVVLFVLGTLFVAATVTVMAYDSILEFNSIKSMNHAAFLSYLTHPLPRVAAFGIGTVFIGGSIMNVIADCMLIHRCYVIWDFNPRILYPLAVVATIIDGLDLGTSILGVYGQATHKALSAYRMGGVINDWTGVAIAMFTLLLALITGGRIWWISYRARRLIGMPPHRKYNAIVQIIIESGILYAAFMVAALVVDLTVLPTSIPFDIGPTTTLMSGLAPTLIIVRVAYGTSINSVQQMVSTMHFAEGGDQAASTRSGIERRNPISDGVFSSGKAQDTQDASSD